MAKKTIKKKIKKRVSKKAVKKKIKKQVPKKAVKNKNKKAVSKKSVQKNGFMTPVIIASGIIITAAILGIITSKIRSTGLEKKVIQSETNRQFITIKDKDTNKSYKLPIKPASASEVSLPPRDNPKEMKNNKYLFNEITSKQEIRRITLEEAKILFNSGKAVFVDTRSEGEYQRGHIKGAVPIPVSKAHLNIPKYEKELKNKILVTYCHGAGCRLSDKVAYKLFAAGYKNVHIFF